MSSSRAISWIAPARKAFNGFPETARQRFLFALSIAAAGGKADIAKPMHGMGPGVLEIALPFKGDAFRVIYAVQLGDDVWVLHAFQKKSNSGARTPMREIDVTRSRLKHLKEMLR